MRYVKCDIIEIAGPAAIVHICNDLGHWGAGFTKSLSKKWPQAEKAYRAWAKNKVDHDNNPFKLGSTTPLHSSVSAAMTGFEKDIGSSKALG